jgi:hypothetical protein
MTKVRSKTFTPDHFTPREAIDEVRDADGTVIVEARDAYVPQYQGTVTMRAVTYDEYLEIQAELEEKAGNVGARMKVLSSRARSFFLHCDIKRDDGAVFKTWDDIECETGLFPVISEVAAKIRGVHRTDPTKAG